MMRRFTDIEKETLYVISNNVSQSLANAHQFNKLEFMAHHDSLTGLPNRSYFHRAFRDRSNRPGFQSASLLLLDLDRFKEINDTLGHHIGDELLQKIGPRLNRAFTSRDILISRLGGDEFTVLLEGVPGRDDIVAFAERVLDCLREPFSIGEMTLEIDASIGIARYPQDGEDSHALLRSADVAMYEAKSRGSGINLYDREQDKHTPERLALTAELNNAIRNNDLLLHYQPKVDLNSGDVCGFEALVRWQHDRLGLLYPDKFIPLAEVGDSIHHLTRKVLDIALRQQQQWFNAGYQLPVSVNLSARNLIDERCTEVLRELLERYGTPRGMLELEITETALMQDADTALQQLMQMADLGIKLSIDDFGTGYSSLSYLRRMPIDALKIDRMFVKDMLSSNQDTAIVSSTIALAHNLGLNVIAEGVEDEATMDCLKDNNCDQVQGYFVCRPAAWDDIESWLKQRTD
jgi:diguanylate cyclase (GGDEF)-like protein